MKYLIAIALCISIYNTNAQTFSLVDSAKTTYCTTIDGSLSNPNLIYNHSGANLNMFWYRYYEDLTPGWDISSCIPTGCMPIGVDSGSYVLDTSFSSLDYHNCHFHHNGIPGYGEARMIVKNVDTQEQVTLSWYAYVGVTGVEENKNYNFQLLSNGSKNVSINYQTNNNVNYYVYSLNGKLFNSGFINGSGELKLNGLESGNYIINFQDNNSFNSNYKILVKYEV